MTPRFLGSWLGLMTMTSWASVWYTDFKEFAAATGRFFKRQLHNNLLTQAILNSQAFRQVTELVKRGSTSVKRSNNNQNQT
jgi:stalled ribosome alternative rescue factor ArfA